MSEGERRPRSWQVGILPMRPCMPAFVLLLLVPLLLTSWSPASGQGQEGGEGSALELTLDDAIRVSKHERRQMRAAGEELDREYEAANGLGEQASAPARQAKIYSVSRT